MDEDERWLRASEWDARFSPFRRRRPVFAGLMSALSALITLAIFLGAAGVNLGQFWIGALVSITAMMLIGYFLALLRNRKAKSAYSAEYRRLNKIGPASDNKERAK
jgi:hypothetical protein